MQEQENLSFTLQEINPSDILWTYQINVAMIRH